MKLPARVAIAINLHQIINRGERVVVAVSGGPDSLALLSLLREILPAMPLHLTVAHFDHGWRPDSEADRDFVAGISARWGFDFRSARAEPGTPQTENAARTARYAFLRQVARETNSTAIALAHTQDDQVETLLLHLLRGSGSRGLAAMRRRDGDLARPLLDVTRAELEAYLQRLALTPRRDPSNEDLRFTRNRLRGQVMPAIDRFDPSARELLARTADILAEEDRYLEDQVSMLPEGAATNRALFGSLPPALQRRVIRKLMPAAGFLEVETWRRGEAVEQPQPRDGSIEVQSTLCRCDPRTFHARDQVGHLDADLVKLPLEIRQRQPGERMRPLGLSEPKRLQDILVDARIPRHLRDALPIIHDAEEIVWIPGVTVSETKRVSGRTTRQLHLEIVRR